MKQVFTDVIIVVFSIALWYLSLFFGIFADFLFLGVGASASSQKPIFPIILSILHLIVTTVLFIRRKIIDNVIVYIVCLACGIILLYVHVLLEI